MFSHQGLAALLKSDPENGLSGNADDLQVGLIRNGCRIAHARQQRKFFFGKNQMPEVKAATLLELIWDALGDTTLVILMIAAVVSIVLGATLSENKSVDWIEGVAILLAVFTVATVTAVTDSQKESQFRELQAKQARPRACSDSPV